MTVEIAAIIAVVIIAALFLAKRVGFSLTEQGVSLSTDKNTPKDTTSVEEITKSTIDIETREGQDISVKKVDDSDVKVK